MSTVLAANTVSNILDDDDSKALPTQDICGRNINQTKLTALLRMKFGVGAYDIHVSCSQVSEYLETRGGSVLTAMSSDDAQLLLHHSSKKTFTCKPIFADTLKNIANKEQSEIVECTRQ